jgi:hypothetical protein
MNNDNNGGAKRRLSQSKHCATGSPQDTGSCLHKDLIKKVATIMNALGKGTSKSKSKRKSQKRLGKRKNKSKKVRSRPYEPIDPSLPCSQIHGLICKNLEEVDGCQAEACMLFKENILKRLSPTEREEFEDSFKPPMDEDMLKDKVKMKRVQKDGKSFLKPKGEVDIESWLSTDNILRACLLDETHKGYRFCGVEPIDFADCKVSSLCRFNPETHRKQGFDRLGFVFNTDTHDDDGEHWISLYMDLGGHNSKGPAIYYFDSYGREPPSEVDEFIEKTRNNPSHRGPPIRYFYNDEPFQKRGSQCGMYSIHFLREMAQGRSFHDYLNSKPNDDMMKDKRYEYFIAPEEV